ncbi:hypothetical protein ElyMa_006518000 [Elysia marginata]|uniref:BZIP domain-containing protein n=1 Tax=Elysia marginata TaxID=1093978 RepID=A0AAV4I4E6_9GAST|nr:hypothetical protein ElyMa_006518000 [Elysia marginata]
MRLASSRVVAEKGERSLFNRLCISSRIPDSVFLASDAIRNLRPATEPEVQENSQTAGDTGEESAEGELAPPAVGKVGAADHNSDEGEGGLIEPIQTVSFDDMDQLDFLNGLMIDITDDEIEQAVEASNLSRLVDTLPSPIAATPAPEVTPATATEATATAAIATSASATAAPEHEWRAEIDAVFEMRPAPSKETTPRKSRAILTHRLLTSEKIINGKREQLEKKRKEEAAKKRDGRKRCRRN